MGECGRCLQHMYPGIWCLIVHGGVRAERFKVPLTSVSDCHINQLFFAGERLKTQCVVVLVLAVGW